MSVRSLWRLWALLLAAVTLAWLTLQERPAHDAAPVAAVRRSAPLPTLAPLPRATDPQTTVAQLAQSTLWGPIAPRAASGAAGTAEAPPPKWSLTGYYELAGTRYVVVSFDQPAMASLQLKVGDRLPDGSRIERIEPDRVRARAPASRGPSTAAATGGPVTGSGWLPVTPGLDVAPTKGKR